MLDVYSLWWIDFIEHECLIRVRRKSQQVVRSDAVVVCSMSVYSYSYLVSDFADGSGLDFWRNTSSC